MEEFGHKTIFVLDHTQYFGIPSESKFGLDFINNKVIDPPLPISKSLWTTSVETAAEYCRIVWDLFPSGKLIRFVVSDANAHIVNTWSSSTQNLTHVMNAMAMVGVPPNTPQSSDYSVIHGMRAAVEALAEPTDAQTEQLAAGEKLINTGRVICITSARDDASMKSLEDIFFTVLTSQNKMVGGNNQNYLEIHRCHLVIVNLYPASMNSMVNSRPCKEVHSSLISEVHSVAARDFSNKLTHLIMPHYDLASTTVTGIPMKEEQNANSSANYDVEIFHSRNAHAVILGSELLLPTSVKTGAEYETVTLKWCTPRGMGAAEMQPCLAQHRVTPVDVTSRPSSCLINFLLNGRSVLLEMPRKTGGKITSHLLSAHGGEIFIHTLHISRNCLEDLPSIMDGGGGKVTDYRINDFAAFIQNHKLVPLKVTPERTFDRNLTRLRAKLMKHSSYWPLNAGSTIIYSIRQFVEPLLNIVAKDEVSDDDVLKCQKIVYNLLSLESRQEPLTLPMGAHRLKGSKKEEQYRLLWAELEMLLELGPQSAGHKRIFKIIKNDPTADKNEDVTMRDVDASKRLSIIANSPMSPPGPTEHLVSKSKNANFPLNINNNRSLYDIRMAAEQTLCQKRLDFAGRLCTPIGQIAKLYPNLKVNEEGSNGRDADKFAA